MSIMQAINEWITINDRVYNAFAMKHIIFSLREDGWLEQWDQNQYHFWLDNYIHNGPMPGCTRFAIPVDDSRVFFLEALEYCWNFYWHEREEGDLSEEDEAIVDDDTEVGEIIAVARWVRDIFQEEIGEFMIEDLPVAEVLEIVD